MAKPRMIRLVLAPARVELAAGSSAQWTVSAVWSTGQIKPVSVVWRATGGTITRSGRYTAGATDGVYAVTATQVGGSVSATAEVLVKKFVIRNAAYGPQATMTCPGGAVAVAPGAGTIQAATAAEVAGTTFCLGAGTYSITGAITPKAGNVYVGAYGAIIDGTGWSTADGSQAAFRATTAINDVTIRNLVIQNMPQKGIYGVASATGWTIDYCEITGAVASQAVSMPSNSIIHHCYLHHNTIGAYGALSSSNVEFQYCDISFNGSEQKIVGSPGGVCFRHCYVHDNDVDGIWYDSDNLTWIVEYCVCEDNGRDGISTEISGSGIIRDNTVKRNADHGIFISTSKDTEVHHNIIENNFRGVHLHLGCSRIGGGSMPGGHDLATNSIHHNTITVPDTVNLGALGLPTASGQAYGCALSNESTGVGGGCEGFTMTPYTGVNNTKLNQFDFNDYLLPSNGTTPRWFFWPSGTTKNWTEWQALGHDASGTALP